MFVIYRHGTDHRTNGRLSTDMTEFRANYNQYVALDQAVRHYCEVYHPEQLAYIEIIDEAMATHVLEYVSKKTPGVEWHMAKVIKKAVSPAAPPVITEFTEKGALPK